MSSRGIDRINRAKESINKMHEAEMERDLGDVHDAALNPGDRPIQQIPLEKLRPAPLEWNFFPPISDGKMLEMILSIQESGLFNPVILWKKGLEYMILSGHNRVEAYRRILTEYGEVKGFNPNEYESIPSIVYSEKEIDENKAKEIIIDTNYIQRDEDKRLMPLIVKNRIEITRHRKDKKGRTIEIVAKELGLSRTKVYEDYIIGENIISEISDLFFDGHLTKKSLLRFSWYSKKIQEHLFRRYKDKITNENSMKIRKNMSKAELENIFEGKAKEKVITMQVRVPESLRVDFREMCDNWLKDRIEQ